MIKQLLIKYPWGDQFRWYDFKKHRFTKTPVPKRDIRVPSGWRDAKTGRTIPPPVFYKPPVEYVYVKVTLYYSGTARNSWYIDAGVVVKSEIDEAEEKISEAKSRILDTVADTMGWPRYDKWHILDTFGVDFGVSIDDRGVEEEWVEAWRI